MTPVISNDHVSRAGLLEALRVSATAVRDRDTADHEGMQGVHGLEVHVQA